MALDVIFVFEFIARSCAGLHVHLLLEQLPTFPYEYNNTFSLHPKLTLRCLQITSLEPGHFNFVIVFDRDTVLDTFFVETKSLLHMQRSMQTTFTPTIHQNGNADTDSDPDLAKTTFQVTALLSVLEDMSMRRVFLT